MNAPRTGILFLLLFLPGVTASDWPQWRGPARDGHVPAGEAVPSTLPTEAKVLWRVKVGEGLASPVVVGGKVFYSDAQGGQETAHAVNATDGKEFWRTNVDKLHSDFQSAPGPRCTPVVDGDRVYFQSCMGELRCLDAGTGAMRWHVNYPQDFGEPFLSASVLLECTVRFKTQQANRKKQRRRRSLGMKRRRGN